jgi:hypothetical protein
MSAENPKPISNARVGLIVYSILLVLLLIPFTYIYFFEKGRTDSILAHKGFTRGLITRITEHTFSKQPAPIAVYEYSYTIKGIRYTSQQKIPKNVIRDSLIGKAFPLIYDTTATYSPNIAPGDLLITPDDFKKYKMPFPDSLKWLGKYISAKN